jgi:hypothetical protein
MTIDTMATDTTPIATLFKDDEYPDSELRRLKAVRLDNLLWDALITVDENEPIEMIDSARALFFDNLRQNQESLAAQAKEIGELRQRLDDDKRDLADLTRYFGQLDLPEKSCFLWFAKRYYPEAFTSEVPRAIHRPDLDLP